MDQLRHARRKPASEDKRRRDVFLLYGTAFQHIPHLDDETCSPPQNHVPILSADSTLTALAQLAAFRLNVRRAMISLIDDRRQYILAEATPDTSLRPESPADAASTLWLGSASIPRACGLCEKVLDIDLEAFAIGDFPTLVIRDFHENIAHKNIFYLRESTARFYAGAPLLSPAGAIVGSLSIYDDEARPHGLSKEHQRILWEISESVMDYLNTYTIKEQYRRGERFTRGLVSFSEGASTLQPFKDDGEQITCEHSSSEVQFDVDSSDLTTPREEKGNPLSFQQQPPKEARPARTTARRYRSIRNLQETILPNDSRSMFTRAANVMMASSDLEGVLILDASGNHAEHNSELTSGTEGEISYQSKSSSSDESGAKSLPHLRGPSLKTCQVLGQATKGISRDDDKFDDIYSSFLEKDLARMLHDFPHGKIITFGAEGFALSSTDESPPSTSTLVADSPKPPRQKTAISRAKRNTQAVQAMLPNARSIAFVPLWDYERSRWFAGCLCWTNSNQRLLSASVDLAYLKVFSHCIMRELSSLDAIASNKAKTSFISSISHELRSPLHGILGSLEFLKDTPLDFFQSGMLNSLNACGQTLLDTLNHIMDHAKISESRRKSSSKKLKDTNTLRLQSKIRKGRNKPQTGSFDLAIATEEVVEAVFLASSYVPISSPMKETRSSSSDSGTEETAKRKICFVVLNIAQDDLFFSFPIGSWKRIVMNLFGNAIKYTESGYISVSLRVNEGSKATGSLSTVTLSITDTGIGMSPQFLANKAFQPFSQENTFAPGTGLGLSIVKQIIETNGGKIEVSSDLSVGTKVTVKVALSKPPDSTPSNLSQRSQFLSLVPRFEGRRICILKNSRSRLTKQASITPTDDGLTRFADSLAITLEKHLKMQVVRTSKWDGHDSDIVIVPELSFEYLAAIRNTRLKGDRAPVTVFVAMDALEAATLRSDVRVQKKESVVEIIAQPCGPYKLAFVLNQCLDRFALPEENLQPRSSGTQSPQPAEWIVGKCQWSSTLPIRSLNAQNHLVTELPPSRYPSNEPLPFADAYTAMPRGQSSPTASLVLIVDDNAINRKLLIAFMKKNEYQYQEAEDGLQALEAYRLASTKFTVILMDMSMPVMDGMTSTRAIRQHEQSNNLPRCRIVALTGLASASARLEALNSGVDHFMTKPVNFKTLGGLMKREDQRRKTINSGAALRLALEKEEKRRLAEFEKETEVLEREEQEESVTVAQQEHKEEVDSTCEEVKIAEAEKETVQSESEKQQEHLQD